jgi:hypothetical protein
MAMSQAPTSIEDALKLMLKGNPATIQKRLPIYQELIKTSADKSLKEAKVVVGYVFLQDSIS